MNKVVTLTKSQELIWMGQQMNPDAPLYNMAFAFDIYDAIDTSDFQASFVHLVSVTDAMRMVFPDKELSLSGVILSNIPFVFKYIDLSKSLDAQRELQSILNNRCKEIFDLGKRNFDSALFKINEKHFVWYLNQHHLITDGWSKAVLFKRMSAIYANRRLGKSEDVSYPEYADFIDFEKKKKSEAISLKTVKYWNESFGNFKPMYVLGGQNTDLSTKSKRIRIHLGQTKVDALKKIALEPEVRGWTTDHTLYTIFLSLYYIQLYRLSSNKELLVGSPVHNRSQPNFKESIGLFIELFPIAVDVSEDDTFLSVLNKTQLSTFEFLKNARSGCSSGNVNRQFSAVLNYINVTFGEFAGAATMSNWLHTGHSDPRHSITLQIHNFNATGGLNLSFDFNAEVFPDNYDGMAADQFMGLLDCFILDRSQSIHALTSEEFELLNRFNDSDKVFPKPSTVLELIEKQVVERPELPAITFKEKTLTFQQLDNKANQLGHLIQSYGIGKGDLVGVCMDRSLEMILALLGILKAGAAYVPIDPTYPEDRIQFILDDIDAKVIITNNGYESSLENKSRAVVLELNEENDIVQGLDISPPLRSTGPSDLIYIMYTSGSSGKPKGVMNQHDGIINLIYSLDEVFELSPNRDVLLQKTTFCFDVSVAEIFYPLAVGVKVVIAEPGGHMDPLYLEQVIDRHGVTMIHFVPSMLDVFLSGITSHSCEALDHVICIGEALKKSTAKAFYRNLPSALLHNMYGPTEAAVVVTHKLVANSFSPIDRMTIGRPLNNVKMHVLNHLMEPCAVGAVGELCIEGVQVARGYHNRELLNKKYFVIVGGRRLYKSGDLGRWLPTGELECLGRIDDQIKIRGFRVELQEIESIALQYSGVEMCAVRAIPDYMNSTKLVLNYTASAPIDTMALQSYMKGKLPEYMIPSVLIQLETMPLNTNGKLDKAALPIPDYNLVSSSLEIIKPSNEFESIILDIWDQVLDVKEISTRSAFFSIGGDSLLGIRVIGKINEVFEINLPVVTIFRNTTISQLAQRVEELIKELLLTLED